MKGTVLAVVCTILLASCGSGDGTIEKTNGQTVVKNKVVNIVIKDGKVTPQGERVEVTVDQPVTLRVTTDSADEVHVHTEPEHEYEVTPGPAKDFTFTVGAPGQVAVESHHLDVTVVQLVVRP